MAFKQGRPREEDLWTLAKHILKFWKQLGRVLEVERHILDEIEVDYSQVYEQSLEMLNRWLKSNGSHATYGVLGEALVHPSVDRYDLMVMVCCPNASKEKVPLSNSLPKEVDEDENTAQEMGLLSIQEDLTENNIYPKVIPSVSILLGEPFHKTYQREKELRALQTLYASLDQNNTCNDVTMVYVTGPPGSGKTQLSRLYSKWYSQQSFPGGRAIVVATLHAETAEALLESYIELTKALRINMEDHEKHDDIKKKLQLYSKTIKNLFKKSNFYNFDWLIVVDNVFASDPLKEYWPLPGNGWGNGRVIVTTQDSELAPSAHTNCRTLSLSKGMDPSDAIDFLCVIAELQRDESCDVVANKLNYYPLSLACAAVFVRDMRHERPAANFTWKDYLANLEKYFELLKYSEFTDHNICYPRSMLSAAVCSASRMAESNSVLRNAFRFLSFCTIQPIPLDLVAQAVSQSMEDEFMIPDVLKKKLAQCSLLSYPRRGVRGIEVVTMHQVVRAAFVQLRKVSSKAVADTEGGTVRMVDDRRFMETLGTLCEYYDRFQTLDEQAIHTRILLSPHLQGMVNAAQNTALTHNEAFIEGSVCFADSLIHVEGGTDHQRVQLLEAAYKIQKELNLKNLLACRLLGDLGYTYREAGRLDDVIPVIEEAITIAEKHDGLVWMKQRSKILNILGWTYRETYHLDLASAYMLMSVDVTKQAYRDQDAQVIERLCNYGIILNDSWKNAEAIEVMEEAQRIVDALGTDSKSSVRAQVLNYTAKIYLRWYLGVYYSEGLTEKARDLLTKSKTLHENALDIYEHLHGKEHKFYLGTAMTYATVLCHVGQVDLGQEYCEQALRVYRSSGHLAWPRVATILADIYLEKRMFVAAKKLLEEAIKGLNEFGVDMRNPRAWLPHARLAEALLNTGEKERGVAMLKQCLTAWDSLHPEHYWVVRARKVLANVPNV